MFVWRSPTQRERPLELDGRRLKVRSAEKSGLVCPTCGESFSDREHAVHIEGRAYHARCALYRARPGRSS